jgi:hypothetical protein
VFCGDSAAASSHVSRADVLDPTNTVGNLPTPCIRGIPGEGGELEGTSTLKYPSATDPHVSFHPAHILLGLSDEMPEILTGDTAWQIPVGMETIAPVTICVMALQVTMKYFQNVVDIVRDLMSPTAQEKHYKEGAYALISEGRNHMATSRRVVVFTLGTTWTARWLRSGSVPFMIQVHSECDHRGVTACCHLCRHEEGPGRFHRYRLVRSATAGLVE